MPGVSNRGDVGYLFRLGAPVWLSPTLEKKINLVGEMMT